MSEDKTFYTNTIPSKENILSEVLKGAIDGTLPAKIDRKSIATTRLYEFYRSRSFGDHASHRLNTGMDFDMGMNFTTFSCSICLLSVDIS